MVHPSINSPKVGGSIFPNALFRRLRMKNITGFFKLLEVDGVITVEVVYEALRSPV
tara:strand:- start:334 stop:501 length:168 start_codon:yes stop_codon:yes gene_type:complete